MLQKKIAELVFSTILGGEQRWSTVTIDGKIDSFASLEPGWNYGRGTAPSKEVRRSAKEIAAYARSEGFSKMDAFPGIDGAVTVVIYEGADDHSFEVKPNLSIRYWNESTPELDFEENLSGQQVWARIRSFRKTAWNLLCSFISATGTPTAADSEVRPSAIPVMAPESPVWTLIVLKEPSDAYASMHGSITQQSAPNPQSIGALTKGTCLQAAL